MGVVEVRDARVAREAPLTSSRKRELQRSDEAYATSRTAPSKSTASLKSAFRKVAGPAGDETPFT
jgi:hypothetical protein